MYIGPVTVPLDFELEVAAKVFKALADPARLRILVHLAQNRPDGGCCGLAEADSVCACDLEAVTGLSQPTVSHHMRNLVAAQLVRAEKRGRWMYYHLDPEGFALAQAFLAIGGEKWIPRVS
ncbi:MAG: metalloregulator ArsR/SmtB family transcription factor [Thermaceae bacterium]|nr:metalloregulator ArsR/SmtB family transcription factor [Thermaceae bacterium]